MSGRQQRTRLRGPLLPPHAPGMRIGLLGGSFNPPHDAHRQISLIAIKRLSLDRIWWLVTPGNPLKDTSQLPPLDQRIADAKSVARHPSIDVTGLEAVINTRYTVDTIRWLILNCPGIRFVWVMGADNLREFHRWRRWKDIAALVPIAVVDRAGSSLTATASPAARALEAARVPEYAARSLAQRKPPAWVFLHGIKSSLSSTGFRASNSGSRGG